MTYKKQWISPPGTSGNAYAAITPRGYALMVNGRALYSPNRDFFDGGSLAAVEQLLLLEGWEPADGPFAWRPHASPTMPGCVDYSAPVIRR